MELIKKFMGFILRNSYEFVSGIISGDSNVISNYAIAIIIMGVIIKVITLPLTLKSSKSMAQQRALQPKLEEIQKKYGNDQQTIARKQQELYQEAGINPLGGCLPLLIQMPILYAMWQVVREPVKYVFTEPGLYESINKSFIWIKDLNEIDSTLILPIIAALVSYLNSKIMTRQNQPASTGDKEKDAAMQQSNTMMQVVMPVMLFFLYKSLPAVLPLYMVVSMVLTTVVQIFVNRIVERDMAELEGEKK